MGSKSKEIVATTECSITVKDDKKTSQVAKPPAQKKKKSGPMHLVRVALFMLRGRRSKKSKSYSVPIEVASGGILNKVVGSMRPLHAQGDESPQHEIAAVTMAVAALPSPPTERVEDVLLASPVSPLFRPQSPAYSSASDGCPSRYASTANLQELDACSSQYASALNLQELDKALGENSDEDNTDNVHDSVGGYDEMIDAKAEEFIAQFYQQMRMQNYNERIRRQAKHRDLIE